MGDVIQKESVKTFIKTQLSPSLAAQQCEEYCKDRNETKGVCTQLCLSQISNKTEESVNGAVDEIYKKEFFGITINDVSYFISQFLIFVVLAVVSAALVLFVSQTPLTTLGKNMISVSISLFISSFSPDFLFLSSNLPFIQSIFDYLASAFKQQMNFGIIFLIAGIALLAVGYTMKYRKSKKAEKKK
jgi:hypothetical protein